jgi:hypothetical protein
MSNISHNWKCPISGELMVDPVSTPEGITYDKPYILEWLQTTIYVQLRQVTKRIKSMMRDFVKKAALVERKKSLNEELKTGGCLAACFVASAR